jgi:excisionase family DNA binding protein
MKLASELSLSTLLSVGEAAQALRVSELTIRRMCRDGRLRSGRLGTAANSQLRIPVRELERLLERRGGEVSR